MVDRSSARSSALGRRLGALALGLAGLAVAADATAWQWTERQLQAGFAQYVAARRVQGWTITWAPPVRGGWPWAATLAVPELRAVLGDAAGPASLAWTAERLVLRVAARAPHMLHVEPGGVQHVRVRGVPELTISTQQFDIAMPVENPEAADIHASGLRAAAAAWTLEVPELRAAFVTQPGATREEPALALSLAAAEMVVPAAAGLALGPQLRDVAIEVSLSGPLNDAGGLAQQAAAWRDGGGALQLDTLAASWGKLHVHGRAQLGLDAGLQPEGDATLWLAGQNPALESLVQAGWLTSNAALAAKAVLGLMAGPAPGEGAEVEVPLRLQHGVVAMGRIPLLRVPALVWPGS